MTEMQSALAMVAALPRDLICESKGGRFYITGRTDVRLLYTMKDGSPLTEQMQEIIWHCGAGIVTKKIASRDFATREEAEHAIKEIRG